MISGFSWVSFIDAPIFKGYNLSAETLKGGVYGYT